MVKTVEPSAVKGEIKVPSSKSMTQRAIAAALLAEGKSVILNPSYCNDSLAAISIAKGLGATVASKNDELEITGRGSLKDKILNCGESGLAIRMFSPIAALFPDEIILTGADSLARRPMNMIEEALNQLGATCTTEGGFLPIRIRGSLTGGYCEIDGSVSSQLLTGLLMALPLAERDSGIKVMNLKSRPYIDMTVQALDSFGVKIRNKDYSYFDIPGNQKYTPRMFTVEGDWSGAAFLLVAAAINGELKIAGLHTDSKQSDRLIIDALKKAGARIETENENIFISKSNLTAFEFDATESPDLFPPLVSLAAYCNGVSVIKGVSRLIYKESNRAAALMEEFGKMNITVELKGDLMFVTGGRPGGAQVNPHNDHRIAMAAAVTALGSTGRVYIEDSQCVGKSYPGFFADLKRLGAFVNE
jgi:3-phosphoshikimate 1-carboxyvinyltransferase